MDDESRGYGLNMNKFILKTITSRLLNSPRDLDLSYKMDLEFWNIFGRKNSKKYSVVRLSFWGYFGVGCFLNRTGYYVF